MIFRSLKHNPDGMLSAIEEDAMIHAGFMTDAAFSASLQAAKNIIMPAAESVVCPQNPADA